MHRKYQDGGMSKSLIDLVTTSMLVFLKNTTLLAQTCSVLLIFNPMYVLVSLILA